MQIWNLLILIIEQIMDLSHFLLAVTFKRAVYYLEDYRTGVIPFYVKVFFEIHLYTVYEGTSGDF